MSDMTSCENGIHENGRCYKAGGSVWCGWEYYHRKKNENNRAENNRAEEIKKYIPKKKS